MITLINMIKMKNRNLTMITLINMINMKKRNYMVFGIILLISAIFAMPTVNADFSYRLEVNEVIGNRNIVITYPQTNDKYLLYVKTGCGTFQKGQMVELVTDGDLSGGDDLIKADPSHICGIEQANFFTNKIYVQEVSSDYRKAYVKGEDDQQYYITLGSYCAKINGYKNNYVYVLQGAKSLARSDKVILPDRAGECSIMYLEKTEQSQPPNTTNITDKVPTTVIGVKAFPRNGSVFLAWKKAWDDKGVSHYLISYSKYHIDPKNVPFEDMPNQITTKKTYYTVDGLENEQTYYFYVLAVDTSGNVSSNWSEEATATPKTSIFEGKSATEKPEQMSIKVEKETIGSFLISWTPVSGARQTVILETDGKREFTLNTYQKSNIRILKSDMRKGKKLIIRVRAYEIYGTMKEEFINFDF